MLLLFNGLLHIYFHYDTYFIAIEEKISVLSLGFQLIHPVFFLM